MPAIAIKALSNKPKTMPRFISWLLSGRGIIQALGAGASLTMIGAGINYGYVFPVLMGIAYLLCGAVLLRLK